MGHERDHHGRAEEHFLPAGPFAILPLKGNRSSLVWTESRKEASRIVALSDDEFHGELEQRFGLHLGEIKALDKPRAFPLGYFVARSFIAERGDARGLGAILGPHQRRTFAGERQDRERTRREKMLFGAAVMIPLMSDGDDDAGLIVVPAMGGDTGALAQL